LPGSSEVSRAGSGGSADGARVQGEPVGEKGGGVSLRPQKFSFRHFSGYAGTATGWPRLPDGEDESGEAG